MGKSLGRSGKAIADLGRPNAFSAYLLFLVWALCALFYYFGEIVDLTGWEALRWQILYGVHDLHRVLFLAPIVYAALVFGPRVTVMISIISLMAFLPRALLISPYPDPLVRALIFAVFAGVIGWALAVIQQESRKRLKRNSILTAERDTLQRILDACRDGLVVVGPDYRIRYMNASMIKDVGDSVGKYCYASFKGLDRPCGSSCRLQTVIAGEAPTWGCKLRNGKSYEIVASAYVDSDGVVCQLAVLRDTSLSRIAEAREQPRA